MTAVWRRRIVIVAAERYWVHHAFFLIAFKQPPRKEQRQPSETYDRWEPRCKAKSQRRQDFSGDEFGLAPGGRDKTT